ncbi:MAG TPA: alkaline phosphatase family protein [Terriglobales bacterium]|nr:alkaline phosphatase family protein [Terriglobales bacterium]
MVLDEQFSRATALVATFLVIAGLVACGGKASAPSSPSNPPTSSPTPGAASPNTSQSAMVVMVVEENHAYEQVMGNASMPYLNTLAQQGAVAQQYYATLHPSIPNYFDLTTGAPQTIDNNFPGPLSADNLVRELNASGKTWKVYAEDLPSPGYLGTTVGNYIKHHNPFAYFSDVVNDPNQAANIVPFSQFASDLSAGRLPGFSFVIPNALNDGHSCSAGTTCDDNAMLAGADQWLKNNIGPLLSSSQFQKNGLLLITFDESALADIRHGGGRVPLIALGPKARAGAQSANIYGHENTLKTVCAVLSIAACPGGAASASAEDDLVQH